MRPFISHPLNTLNETSPLSTKVPVLLSCSRPLVLLSCCNSLICRKKITFSVPYNLEYSWSRLPLLVFYSSRICFSSFCLHSALCSGVSCGYQISPLQPWSYGNCLAPCKEVEAEFGCFPRISSCPILLPVSLDSGWDFILLLTLNHDSTGGHESC